MYTAIDSSLTHYSSRGAIVVELTPSPSATASETR